MGIAWSNSNCLVRRKSWAPTRRSPLRLLLPTILFDQSADQLDPYTAAQNANAPREESGGPKASGDFALASRYRLVFVAPLELCRNRQRRPNGIRQRTLAGAVSRRAQLYVRIEAQMHWNKSRRSDHPLADRRHVDEFLARLRRQDAFTVLEESAFWLKASRDAYGLAPARRFEIADTLDFTARAALGKVASDFVSLGSRYHTFQAQRTWNLCFQFARELGATYQYLVDQYGKRPANPS